MHYWGDDWFKKHGEDLHAAISWIFDEMARCHINFMNKEKYGCNDVEWAYFWNGGLYTLIFGYRAHIGTLYSYRFKWLERLVDKFHHWFYFKFDLGCHEAKKPSTNKVKLWLRAFIEKHNLEWKGFANYMDKWGIVEKVHGWQAKQYNRIYQQACKRWPDIIDELISEDCCGYKLIKPCKYGDIDGEAIHNKFWKPLKKDNYVKPEIKAMKADMEAFIEHVDKDCHIDADDYNGWLKELSNWIKQQKR